LVLDGKIDKLAFLKLVTDCMKITKDEPNLVQREGEIVIIGDIHGQFFDMLDMLDELTPRLSK